VCASVEEPKLELKLAFGFVRRVLIVSLYLFGVNLRVVSSLFCIPSCNPLGGDNLYPFSVISRVVNFYLSCVCEFECLFP
jgi:hypothetical protein